MCFYMISQIFLVFVILSSGNGAKIKKYQNQPYYGSYNGKLETSEEEKQDLTKIPGEPGVDYPLYHSVPETSFSCGNVPFVPGIYANVETGCQAYHVCHDGREGHQGASFLCSNGTLFNQEEFTCDWWYKVDCQQAPSLYRLNADAETNPFVPKQKSEEVFDPYKSSESTKYYEPKQYTAPLSSKYRQPQQLSPSIPQYYQP
ncbi:hypothetical protein PGB90_001841 [Kerria lacca]